MNSIQEGEKEDLFHYLTGSYHKDSRGKYFFYLYNPGKDVSSYYETDDYIIVLDPALDASFKSLFLYNEGRLQTFLNDVFFVPNNMEISDLVYIIGDHYDIGKSYDLNSLKADITCKAKIKGIKTVLIDVEIQIYWVAELDNKFFENNSLLRNLNSNIETQQMKNKLKKQKVKRIYNDVLVMAFIVPKNISNKTNKIELMRTVNNSNEQKNIPGINILEINVTEILDELQKKRYAKLFGKNINKDGADWLKLIGLRCWATKESKTLGKYILPKINKNEHYSKNPFINEAILALLKGSDLEVKMLLQLEEEFAENYLKAEKEGFKKNQLITLYNFIKNKKFDDLNLLPLDYMYKEKEVYDILIKTGSIRLDIVGLLLKYLASRSCLELN